jgi:superfamily II DNA or RNA helicase
MDEAMQELASMHGMQCRRDGKTLKVTSIKRPGELRINPIKDWLQEQRLNTSAGHKFVPYEYKTASRQARLDVLAGLLDTDGHCSKGTGYDFISKSMQLSTDVVFIARSLGLMANMRPCEKYSQLGTGGTYWRVSISGDADIIPCRIPRKKANARRQRKDVLVHGFDVEPVGVGDYYGFEIDGDHLYLDGNFIRHHNSGKGLMQSAIANLMNDAGEGLIIYNSRRTLTDQSYERLTQDGIDCGVRAASRKKLQNLPARIQVGSLQTDIQRVLNQEVWSTHDCKLVIIDEAHLTCTGRTVDLIQHYLSRGAKVVGFTGTPIGMSGLYKDIVIAGTKAELRACKAHIPVKMFGATEMDTSHIKPVKTGEYSDGDIQRECWSMQVVGHIVDDYFKFNPDRKPTMAACPGIGESVWLADQFRARGLRVVHIDCNEVVANGERYKNDAEGNVRRQALADFNAGEYDIITNCEVLQQGVDMPQLAHLILARPYGSLANYLQVAGRVLRWSTSTPDWATIQDHGGCYHRWGSPNEQRDWGKLFEMSEPEIAKEEFEKKASKDAEPEPIRCPSCGMIRREGARCPGCGHISEKGVRIIVQKSGELIEHTGRIYKERKERPVVPAQQKIWNNLFFPSRNSKSPRARNFNQLKYEYEKAHGPLPDWLKNIPRDPADYNRKIRDLDWSELT